MENFPSEIGINPPVWTIADKTLLEIEGDLNPRTLGKFMSDDIGEIFPLFTTLETAKSFIRNLHDPRSLGAVSLNNAATIQQVLKMMESAGVQYVAIDLVEFLDRSGGLIGPIRKAINSIIRAENN